MPYPVASEGAEWSGVWWLPAAPGPHADVSAEARQREEPSALGQGTLTYEPDVGPRLRLAGIADSGARPLDFTEAHGRPALTTCSGTRALVCVRRELLGALHGGNR